MPSATDRNQVSAVLEKICGTRPERSLPRAGARATARFGRIHEEDPDCLERRTLPQRGVRDEPFPSLIDVNDGAFRRVG
jgi:hypothetical protein